MSLECTKIANSMDRISPEELERRIENQGVDLSNTSSHDPQVQIEIDNFLSRYQSLITSPESTWVSGADADRVTEYLVSPDLRRGESVCHQVYGDPDSSQSLKFREELALKFLVNGKLEELYLTRFREGDHINCSGEAFIALMRGEEGSIFYPERKMNCADLARFFK